MHLCRALPGAQEHLHLCLLSLTTKVTAKAIEACASGRHKVHPRLISLRGPPPWQHLADNGAVFPALAEKLLGRIATTPSTEAAPNVLSRLTMVLVCPSCGHGRYAKRINLVTQARWASLRCTACQTTKRAGRWLCECNLLWHTCPRHADVGFTRLHKAAAPSRRTVPAKRKAGDLGDPYLSPCPSGSRTSEFKRPRTSVTPSGLRTSVTPQGTKRPLATSALLSKCPKLAAKFPSLVGSSP